MVCSKSADHAERPERYFSTSTAGDALACDALAGDAVAGEPLVGDGMPSAAPSSPIDPRSMAEDQGCLRTTRLIPPAARRRISRVPHWTAADRRDLPPPWPPPSALRGCIRS